jgi:Xaa-Pro aminopeptidase
MIFSPDIYKKRRARLIGSMPENSALILPSRPLMKRSGDVEYFYRPSSNLIYFSGFEESHSCLIILSKPNLKTLLFVQKKDKVKELWTGPVYGPEQAEETFEVDHCYPFSDFSDTVLKILKNNIHSLYYSFGVNSHCDTLIEKIIKALKNKKKAITLCDPAHLTVPLRMQKSEEEIKTIKKATAISSEAHIEVMKHCRAGLNERELHGRFLFEIMKRGAHAEAYPGIFASGPKACILHYTSNNRIMREGELLLVDAGAEYNYYASDITRTFPVNGKFSETQKNIYTKLLEVQKQVIQMLKPGLSFKIIQDNLVELLSCVMKDVNILSGPVKNIIQEKKYKKYFPHSFGHSLGLDVHDPVFSEKENIELKENFIITIEPGIYLPPEDISLKPELRGQGFRIEDDILITKTGAEVLSHTVPKEVKELESI